MERGEVGEGGRREGQEGGGGGRGVQTLLSHHTSKLCPCSHVTVQVFSGLLTSSQYLVALGE